MKTDKQIIVMTPASLRMNYLQELKNVVILYKKINFGNLFQYRYKDPNKTLL
jgi:hypothetical protein